MANLRNKRKLAALNNENCEEHPSSNLAENWNVPRSKEDHISQDPEEIERKVKKKFSLEFSRTKNPILGALSRLEPANSGPLRSHSGDVPERIWHKPGNEWWQSESDPHPEAGIFQSQRTRNWCPEDGHDTNQFGAFKRFISHSISSLILYFLFTCLSVWRRALT